MIRGNLGRSQGDIKIMLVFYQRQLIFKLYYRDIAGTDILIDI